MNASPCLLIVDQDPDCAMSLAMFFEAELPDLDVVPSTSVAYALGILHRRPVDIVLADYRLGGWNGLDFLENARRAQPQAKTILLTSSTTVEIAATAVNRVHVDRLFFKPLDHKELIASVAALCHMKPHVPTMLRWNRTPSWLAP